MEYLGPPGRAAHGSDWGRPELVMWVDMKRSGNPGQVIHIDLDGRGNVCPRAAGLRGRRRPSYGANPGEGSTGMRSGGLRKQARTKKEPPKVGQPTITTERSRRGPIVLCGARSVGATARPGRVGRQRSSTAMWGFRRDQWNHPDAVQLSHIIVYQTRITATSASK